MDDKRMEKIGQGSLAEVALSFFEEQTKEQMRRQLMLHATQYRGGQFTENNAIAFIASYCALEDVLADLKRKVTQANTLNKEIIDHGNAPN